MMQQQRPQMGWPAVAGLAAVAAALGFGASHWLAARNAPPAEPTAAASPASSPAAGDNATVEVRIPAEYLAAAKIAVEPVGNGGLEAEILTSGTVVAPPNSAAVVVARVAGNVTRVNRQLGDAVRAGEALAQVDSSEAAAMTADRNVAAAKVDLARKSYARESSLFAQGVTPRQDMEAAQAALAVAESEAQRASSVAQAAQVAADGKSVAVVSPISGKITAQMLTLGGFVQPQTELFRVAGEGQALVEVSLPAAEIGRVSAGDRASIFAANGRPVEAIVRSVTPTVSGSTRTATVVLTPMSPTRDLIVGEGVQARLHVKHGVAGLVVPEDAVQNVDGHDVLFVRTKDGFRAQAVLVGTRSGGVAQIVSGVTAGQRVATHNAFLVKADMIKSAKDE
jgi:cobalt-zinc-cadmium efflux system membrane fusion protein